MRFGISSAAHSRPRTKLPNCAADKPHKPDFAQNQACQLQVRQVASKQFANSMNAWELYAGSQLTATPDSPSAQCKRPLHFDELGKTKLGLPASQSFVIVMLSVERHVFSVRGV